MVYALSFFKKESKKPGMLISELAKRVGLSVHTLRYYENYGLIKGERDESVKTNNYKQYPPSLVEKIVLIKEAKEIGFTLAEIKALLEDWYGHQLSVARKVEVLTAKIAEIDDRIQQLQRVRHLLVAGIEEVERGEC
jgi:MerR family Zn(II)-responsive transcriptional regulator of zntA